LRKIQKADAPEIHSERKRGADEAVEVSASKRLKVDDDPLLEDEDAVVSSEVAFTELEGDNTLPKSRGDGRSKSKSFDRGNSMFKENPYTFLDPDDPILHTCINRLHITGTFPSSNVLVRNPEGAAVRSLYLVNDIVKVVIQNNNYERIRLTAAGTKVFAKQEAGKGLDAQFRILGEGLPVILPYINPSSIITANIAILRVLVESHYPLCSKFDEPFRAVIEGWESGSHIVKFLVGSMSGVNLAHDLVLPIWKSNVSLTLMVDKKAKSALSLRLFGADITKVGKKPEAGLLQKEG
jgi:multisite-specific tRNA:(cytosine-C5)-methyltransferase